MKDWCDSNSFCPVWVLQLFENASLSCVGDISTCAARQPLGANSGASKKSSSVVLSCSTAESIYWELENLLITQIYDVCTVLYVLPYSHSLLKINIIYIAVFQDR